MMMNTLMQTSVDRAMEYYASALDTALFEAVPPILTLHKIPLLPAWAFALASRFWSWRYKLETKIFHTRRPRTEIWTHGKLFRTIYHPTVKSIS
jgi:hypothetical protein